MHPPRRHAQTVAAGALPTLGTHWSRLVCRASSALRHATLAGLVVALGSGGCPTAPTPADNLPFAKGGNGTFATAADISLGDDDQVEFTGTINSTDDTDIFNLGVLAPGDRLFVDIQTIDGNLDPLAAVFDQREFVHAFNDDRVPDASDLNPLIDVIIRGPEGAYFLGVVSFPGGDSTGKYRVIVQVTRNVGLLDPEPQIVYLNWAGGQNIRIENVGTFNVEPFDAADLGPYDGRTDELKNLIQAVVADRYDGFNLVLLNSDDDAVPRLPHSTIYFGNRSLNAFAIAQQVDTFNAQQDDDAIIFTDGFRGAFSITPTLEQMATAIGNTAAHEVGHLLGLVHTNECASLMDARCGNDALLVEQVFKLAPLDESVFPVGLQNALELIEWAVGLANL